MAKCNLFPCGRILLIINGRTAHSRLTEAYDMAFASGLPFGRENVIIGLVF